MELGNLGQRRGITSPRPARLPSPRTYLTAPGRKQRTGGGAVLFDGLATRGREGTAACRAFAFADLAEAIPARRQGYKPFSCSPKTRFIGFSSLISKYRNNLALNLMPPAMEAKTENRPRLFAERIIRTTTHYGYRTNHIIPNARWRIED